jgi:hypothetical protein
MIKASKLHETFRRDINRINSGYLKSISVIDVDGFLTEAWFTIYENLVVKSEKNPLADDRIRQKLKRDQVFSSKPYSKDAVRIDYPKDLYRVVRRYANVCREGCDTRMLNVHLIQTHQLNESLRDTNWEPSFEWEETISLQDSTGLIVYTDNSQYKEIVLDYYTKPIPVRCPSLVNDTSCGYAAIRGSYIDNEGNSVSTDSDFEIDSTDMWMKVAHLAAAKALMNIGDTQDYTKMLNSIISDEKILL